MIYFGGYLGQELVVSVNRILPRVIDKNYLIVNKRLRKPDIIGYLYTNIKSAKEVKLDEF